MDESDNQSKVVQYWIHVYDVAAVLFENSLGQMKTLQSLVDSILNTKLINEIECLAGNNENEDFPFPFTAWLLERMYISSVNYVGDPCYEQFFVNSQVQLLQATFDRNSYEYVLLINLHLAAIEKMCRAQYNETFTYLTPQPQTLINTVIPPLNLSLSSEKERLRFIDISLQVITNVSKILCLSIRDNTLLECIGIVSGLCTGCPGDVGLEMFSQIESVLMGSNAYLMSAFPLWPTSPEHPV